MAHHEQEASHREADDIALAGVEQLLEHLKTAAAALEASAKDLACDMDPESDMVAEADRARCQASEMRSVASQVGQEISAARNGNKKITSGFVNGLQSKITTALQQGEAGAAEVAEAHETSIVAHAVKAVKAFAKETQSYATRRETPTHTASARRSSHVPAIARAPEPSAWERAQRAAQQAADYAAERAREVREAAENLLDRARQSPVGQGVARAGAAIAAFASNPMQGLADLGESAMETVHEVSAPVIASVREMHVLVVEKVSKAKDTVVATVAGGMRATEEIVASASDRLASAAASAKHSVMSLWQEDEKQQQQLAEKKAIAKAQQEKALAQAKAAAAAKPSKSLITDMVDMAREKIGGFVPSLPSIDMPKIQFPSLF